MKRLLLIVYILVFSVFSTGLPQYVHYCADELKSVSYGIPSDGCCGEDESSSKSDQSSDEGCCHNEVKLLKADQGGKQELKIKQTEPKESDILSPEALVFCACCKPLSYAKPVAVALIDDPAPPDAELYILNCNFRI